MKKTKRLLTYALIISVLFVFILIVFILAKSKTWKIYCAFYSSLIITPLSYILVLLSYFSERKELKEYQIDGFIFKPLQYDMYQDLRILMEDKELDNSDEEKELLEKYEEKTILFTKEGNKYLVYNNDLPCALVEYNKNFKTKTAKFGILFVKEESLNELFDKILEKEN